MKICLQGGHEGRTSGSTGAPGEKEFNIDISNQVAFELSKRGFQVQRVNADPKPEEIGGDWDLFLAIHYDADIYGKGGGFVDFPEPSTDGATKESQRIAYLIRQEYFGTTKIVSHPERVNANTKYYYMWKLMSAKTPCVLIECGVGMHVPDDHEVLAFHRPLVVEGIVKGICLAFNVPYVTPPTPSLPPEAPQNPPSEPTTQPDTSLSLIVELSNLRDLVGTIKGKIWGRGFVWSRMNKLKELLPK